ncbi:MAG TPA: hemolysin family protein [Candidatus Mediterraneibacter stercorigallinarum]|uniref:Hemolysin family protein n=1 Tax=Candidatus Mediterraneibacter stercorigallinarum TaxID=2838686 RepID=A0A9D2IJI9_9FIRM|nr:hemolysin family protein [Candidatus Mediterraneibacter stercorigallinarum]
MDSGDSFQLIILVILLMLSAFFSSNETALMSVSKIRLRTLADAGNKRASQVLDVTENHTSKMLSAILIGNNIVNLSASALATSLAYTFGGYMVSIATAVLTIAILVFGEITPKNYATINAEKLALRYIPVIRFIMTVMTPVIFIINLFSRGIMLLLRVDPDAADKGMTEDELRTIVDVSHEDGIIESDEKEMIYNVFDLGDANAKDIMVPRVHVTFADVNNTYEELIEIFREDKFTRLPVYEDSQDNIIGIINMKDLLLYDKSQPFQIREIMRKPHFTYEYKSISELLVEMRDSTFNIAIVLDEYGEMAGLITLEDILEEIVGEIHDEYDETEDELVRRISDREYIIEGSVNLDDVNDRLQTELSSEDYDSLGGLIIEYLDDRLPEVGDEVITEDGIRLVVESLDKNRVESVHVYLPEGPEADDGNKDAMSETEPQPETDPSGHAGSTDENNKEAAADAVS